MRHYPSIESDRSELFDICFLCADGLPLDQLSVAVDYLETSGRLDPNQLLSFTLTSFSGGEVRSSCGIKVNTYSISDLQSPCPLLIFLSGPVLPPEHQDQLGRICRAHIRKGAIVAAIETGLIPLGRTGLLDGIEVGASRLLQSALQEQFSPVRPSEQDFCSKGQIWSAGEGFSVLDLLSVLIRKRGDAHILPALNRKFQSYRLKLDHPCECLWQRTQNEQGSSGDRVVDQAIALFRANLEEPLPIGGVATQLGISVRQLERRFVSATGAPPKSSYLAERLEKARAITEYTTLSIAEVALACGFSSSTALTKRYKQRFGRSPLRDRIERRP